MAYTTVAELTTYQLKDLIRDVVKQTILDLFKDPDEGLELREEIEKSLRQSLAAVEGGAKTIPAEEVAASLGLEW